MPRPFLSAPQILREMEAATGTFSELISKCDPTEAWLNGHDSRSKTCVPPLCTFPHHFLSSKICWNTIPYQGRSVRHSDCRPGERL